MNEKEKLEKWQAAVKRADKNGKRWVATPYSFICSEHFELSDYVFPPGRNSRCQLKPEAVPTIFKGHPLHLQPKEKPFIRPGIKRKQPSPSSSPTKIMRIHNYARSHCDLGKESNNNKNQELIKNNMLISKNIMLQRKIKTLQQKVRRRNTKIKTLKQLINEIERKLMIARDEASLLHDNFDNVQLSVFNNTLQNTGRQEKGRRYNDTVKEFATTLYFYSPKAYNFVRGTLSLPHPSMIRRWSSTFQCEPGFFEEVFQSLSEFTKGCPEKQDCCLILDGMAIRKQILYDPQTDHYVGFVKYGAAIVEPDEQPATEALVFLLTGLQGHWKCPIGYFLINKISANVQMQMVRIALTKAAEIGLRVVCVTCDGTVTNMNMFQQLGCNFDTATYDSVKTTFKHPTMNYNVCSIFDPCHMLKLARNSLADLSYLADSSGEKIEWKYFKDLHALQDKEGLKLKNRLGSKHINYQKNRMKVSLAAQALSSSVADAFEFPRDGLHMDKFKSCGPTVKFIRFIDRVFDILNSRNPIAHGFKQPLRLATEARWTAVLERTAQYLLSLKAPSGQLLKNHRRKTFVIGFVATIKSTLELATYLLKREDNPFKYLLTYKFSQDHIELLFSCIRSKGGWNNNPNVLQLKYAFRKLLLRNRITASQNANCQVFEQNTIIPVFKNSTFSAERAQQVCEIQSEPEIATILNQIDCMQHTEFIENILYYISGFIVAKMIKDINCQFCKQCLLGTLDRNRPDHIYCLGYDEVNGPAAFTSFINNGGLTIPSVSTFRIVKCAEKVFKLHVCKEDYKDITGKKQIRKVMIMNVVEYFWGENSMSEELFDSHPPGLNEIVFEENHERWLTKCVADKYFKIRLFTFGKSYGDKVIEAGKGSQRHQLTKLILFKNQ